MTASPVLNRRAQEVFSFTDRFDFMVTDPPYREAVHRNASSHSPVRGYRHRDLGFSHLTSELQDWTANFAARAVKRWIVIFSDLESVGTWKDALESHGAKHARTIPWVRWSAPQLSGDRPPQGAEAVIVAHGKGKGRKHWNGPGNLTHFAQKCLRGEGKHKAEKPLDLALDLVDYFSDQGETGADPFAGAGTFGLACRLLGRGYLGAEVDAEWAAKANERILAEQFSARDEERYRRWTESRMR